MDIIAGQQFNQYIFQPMQILIGVEPYVSQIQQGRYDQLTRPVIGDITAPVYLQYLNTVLLEIFRRG